MIQEYEDRFRAVWDSILNDDALEAMPTYAPLQFACESLDNLEAKESESDPHGCQKRNAPEACLVDSAIIASGVTHVVTTDGYYLSGTCAPGNFTKQGAGFSAAGKSLLQIAIESRDVVTSRFGLSYNNRAIAEISEPVLVIDSKNEAGEVTNVT